MALKIPKGKEVRIFSGGGKLKGLVTGNVKPILDEDLTITLSSTFSPLFNKSNLAIDAIGGLSGLGSSQFEQMGYQLWRGTDPVKLNLTVRFFVGITNGLLRSAYEEVYSPSLALQKIPLPSLTSKGPLAGSGNLQPPGPNILAAFGAEVQQAFSGVFNGGTTYSIRIGNYFYLPNVIVTRAEPTFSKETDFFGYPIWSKINLEIVSITTATTNLLDGFTATNLS